MRGGGKILAKIGTIERGANNFGRLSSGMAMMAKAEPSDGFLLAEKVEGLTNAADFAAKANPIRSLCARCQATSALREARRRGRNVLRPERTWN